MVNEALICEELRTETLTSPLTFHNEERFNDKTSHFIHVHGCDEKNCHCILQLKSNNLDLNNIVHLNLTKCGLKSIPDNLCDLPLKSLNLSDNSLETVPNCILTGLDCLENLNLSKNKLKEFETEPKCVLNLRVLDLTHNGMKYIPIWIVHSKSIKLEELYFSHNRFDKTNESLYHKTGSYNLKKMILQNSCMLDENVQFIKSVETLNVLDISNNYSREHRNAFTDYEGLFDNATWKNSMEILNLSHLKIAFLPDSIASLISLKELYLSSNNLFWLIDSIGMLINLEILDISQNNICFLPNTVSNLKKLCVINLQHNNLSDIQILDTLTCLEVLDLYENELNSFDLDINQYKYIDLEENHFDTYSLNKSYKEKCNNYRDKFDLKMRTLGCREENSDSDSYCSDLTSEKRDLSDDSVDCDNVVPIGNYDEECWDDKKIRSDPDVTPSDDEWQGYMPTQFKMRKPKENLDRLLENLYVDVD